MASAIPPPLTVESFVKFREFPHMLLPLFMSQTAEITRAHPSLSVSLQNTFLPANTEEDIFAHLGLEYIEPWQRNA